MEVKKPEVTFVLGAQIEIVSTWEVQENFMKKVWFEK